MKKWNNAKHIGPVSFLVVLFAAFHNSFSFMIYTKAAYTMNKNNSEHYIRLWFVYKHKKFIL